MKESIFLIVIIASILQLLDRCSANNIQTEPKGEHVCEKVATFQTHQQINYTVPILEQYSYCCDRFIFCMKYCYSKRYKDIVKTKRITRSHRRISKYCCEGWTQKGTACNEDTESIENQAIEKPKSPKSSWSWIVPTVLFVLFIGTLIVYYKLKRKSIYKGTLLVDQSTVRYNSIYSNEKPMTDM